jgi:hypothetical protein
MIHSPFATSLFIWIGIAFCIIQSAIFSGPIWQMATHQLRGRDQRGQLLPRVECARLYRGLGDADYLGNLLDGFRSA